MVVEMADEDCDTPVAGDRLVEVVVPHRLVVRWTSVASGELLFQHLVVPDKFIQSVEGPLQQDILTADQRFVTEFIAFQHAMVGEVTQVDQLAFFIFLNCSCYR